MIEEITTYLRDKVESFSKWDEQLAKEWITWHWKHASISVVKDGEKIVGVGVARVLKDINMSDDHYYFDDSGDILFVDMLAADNKEAINILLDSANKRYGEKSFYAFKKSKYSANIKVNLMERLMRRLNYCVN